jgi:hypothetical protein
VLSSACVLVNFGKDYVYFGRVKTFKHIYLTYFYNKIYSADLQRCGLAGTPTWSDPKTINTRLPVSNPIMWQFKKVNVPPKKISWHYFGNLLCFSSYQHHSTIPQPNKCFMSGTRLKILSVTNPRAMNLPDFIWLDHWNRL